jgi:hypothetical protein
MMSTSSLPCREWRSLGLSRRISQTKTTLRSTEYGLGCWPRSTRPTSCQLLPCRRGAPTLSRDSGPNNGGTYLSIQGQFLISVAAAFRIELQIDQELNMLPAQPERIPALSRTLLDFWTQGQGRGGQRINWQRNVERLLFGTTQHEIRL